MEEIVKLKFTDVTEYRKKIGKALASRGLENITKNNINVLEIGPGSSPFLVEEILKEQLGNYFFIEPNENFSKIILNMNPSSNLLGAKIEDVFLEELKFDFIYSNFTLHWSNQVQSTFLKIRKSLKKSGKFCFSVTDPSKSFWADVNHEFKNVFTGCDLFKKSPLKAFTKNDWKTVIGESDFGDVDIINFEGQASVAIDGESALREFKRACGDRYLSLVGSFSIFEIEFWLVNYLNSLKNSDGVISIPASGLGFICSTAD